MEKDILFGSCLPPFGDCADRFVLSGYSGVKRTPVEMIKRAGKVKSLSGIELVGTWHLNNNNIREIKKVVEDVGLKICMVTPDMWARGKWGKGGFTSREEKI
ncbi:unnamed protein product, partial [marine sediment metagenome]